MVQVTNLLGGTVMTIQDWGAIGEIVGGVGVIASLLYLAVQIRQNSRVSRNATIQNILGTSALMNAQIAGDVSPALIKLEAEGPLAPDEKSRLRSLFLGIFSAYWQVYYQHRQGMIERSVFEAYERRTLFMLERKFVREWWTRNSFRFSDDYQAYIDELAKRAAQHLSGPRLSIDKDVP